MAISLSEVPPIVPRRRVKSADQSETAKVETTRDFLIDDFPKTLFPLISTKVLIERGEEELKQYISKRVDGTELSFSFAPQKRVYASKPGGYLRRTVKLDVVAEYYIYDLIYRNRALFRKPHTPNRTHYGYRFEAGAPIAATKAYKAFKGALATYSKTYAFSKGMDVATYFNNAYHHDIVSWFDDLGASNSDVEGLSQLLREMSSGRSIDCLPQGLYPTKMIGNDFLRFLDNNHDLSCEQMIRFMDDIYIFSDSDVTVANDFQTIQRLIGNKGFSVNPLKTRASEVKDTGIDKQIDQIKQQLLKRRRILISVGYDDEGEEIVKHGLIKFPLNEQEMSYIDMILAKQDIEEDDAELVLTIMRGHAHRVEQRLPYIISTYPHLAKNVHAFFSAVDRDMVADMVLSHAEKFDRLTENQLFWFCATLSDYLMDTSRVLRLISVLFNHRSATMITKSKILEIDDKRFGLPDLRSEHLANGQSDWLAWSSAVGSRSQKLASRNYQLKHFGRSSPMNQLVATIMLKS